MNDHTKLLEAAQLIPLDTINPKDDRLQTRHVKALSGKELYKAEKDSKQDIAALVKTIQGLKDNYPDNYRKCQLNPIVVWREPGADKYIIVSGFHRYAAYLEFNRITKNPKARMKKIAARVHTGTEAEAELFSAIEDTKAVLPKTLIQKNNAAWKMIYEENTAVVGLSERKLAIELVISRNTIHRMKQLAPMLKTEGINFHPSWKTQEFLYKTKDQEPSTTEVNIHGLIVSVGNYFIEYANEKLQGDTNNIKRALKLAARALNGLDDELDELLELELMDFEDGYYRGQAEQQQKTKAPTKGLTCSDVIEGSCAILEDEDF